MISEENRNKSYAWYTGGIDKLEILLDNKQWPEAIFFSAIYLERHGYFAVKDYLEDKKVASKLIKEFLGRTSLSQIARYLLALGIVTEKEKNLIGRINEERNKFVHRREKYEYLIGTRAKEQYTPLVREAIKILREKLHAEKIVVFGAK